MTGVDLTADVTDTSQAADRYLQPTVHLVNRIAVATTVPADPGLRRRTARPARLRASRPAPATHEEEVVRTVLDFTSAQYLGLDHPAGVLGSWQKLTLGVPATLAPPPGTDAVVRRLAALVGCERATLGTSTLHLFWDLFGLFSPREFAVYLDRGAYAVARWGAERARGRGVQVRWFAHYSTRDLRATFDRAGTRRALRERTSSCPRARSMRTNFTGNWSREECEPFSTRERWVGRRGSVSS